MCRDAERPNQNDSGDPGGPACRQPLRHTTTMAVPHDDGPLPLEVVDCCERNLGEGFERELLTAVRCWAASETRHVESRHLPEPAERTDKRTKVQLHRAGISV